ncbi:hypothetical protein Pcinc_000525 [Petrolisthes cinctipes]|uniref:Aminopeptidase N n=1 Tax=Petrolisthes cinctipes TaxID=88211 RepID=A0AAE1GPD3_PETCI|nr:hypothetical protein Pcinc_000525 [Petrolisthes cinctipes]
MMVSSVGTREVFSVESAASGQSPTDKKNKKGLQVLVNKKVALVLGALLLTATVATSLLAVHFTTQPDNTQNEDQVRSEAATGVASVAAPSYGSKHSYSSPVVPLSLTHRRINNWHSFIKEYNRGEHASPLSSSSTSSSQHQLTSPLEAEDLRLPTSLRPIHYELHVRPFIHGDRSILGSVRIELSVEEATDNITLHINDIITKNATITVTPANSTEESVTITQHLYDHRRQFYTARLNRPLVAGQTYHLYMEYQGYLNDQLAGFYRSTYTDSDGNDRYIAVTHFEPTDARRAFPCFDEPAMKAKFKIFITREAAMTSISNMPLVETTASEAGWEMDEFEETLPVSTYLVAFAVTDFTHTDSNDNDHVLFRIWAREDAINQTQYATECGPAVLTYYETYFDVPFPLPKQDMIAIPDFAAGAMENWGLITYRETALLYDEELSSARNKERVARVIAHELAHQWFGNLVTLEWWNDLWLNEGFASYVEILGTDHISPDWEIENLFVTENLQSVMELDSLESSHPISVPVGDPDEINQLFDGISYDKGASIIRMMNYFLTEDTFRKGITDYLTSLEYSNAVQDDLWAYLTTAAEEDNTLPEDTTVKMIMDTWTLQMGYPVITVTRTQDGTSATLTQERFLSVENERRYKADEYRWWVPITYTTQDNPDFDATHAEDWIKDTEAQITLADSLPASDKWVIFNLQQTGYYRVNYDENNWGLLVQQLETDHTVIHVASRSQLIDDALDLARAGKLSYSTALNVNSYLSEETEYFPWASAMANLGYMEGMFSRRGGYGSLRKYLLSLLEPLYDSVGFDDPIDDPQLDHYKRNLAMSWVCQLNNKDCVDRSVTLYQEWMNDPNAGTITPNQKSTVYCTGIAEGGEAEWNFAWNQYLTTNLGTERDIILTALGCTKEIWILSRYLEMSITEGSGIRRQDASRSIDAVARNDVGRDLAWNFIRDNWYQISDYLGTFTSMGDLVLYVSSDFNTPEEKHQLELFKEQHLEDLGSATFAVDQAIESTDNNIAWMDNYYEGILQWLINNGY